MEVTMENLRLCDSDYRFMTIVWENAPVASGDLVKLCNENLGWKKSTTYTAIKKLSEKGYIKNEEHLLNASPFQLFCGLSDLKLTVMIRAMHQFQVFLPEYITQNLADTIQNIELQLNESIRAIARAHQIDDHYETETFPDFKTAIKTINAAYQQQKEEEKRR